MDLYSFVVTDFVIHHTRAPHNDTLALSHSAYVNGALVAHQSIVMGDFDDGAYPTSDFGSDAPGLVDVPINNARAGVSFVFQLVNAGSGSAGPLSGRLAATADQLAGITAGLSGAGSPANVGDAVTSPAFPAGLLFEAFANLWSWLDGDYDGPVAVDQLTGPRRAIDADCDNTIASILVTRRYVGNDSPSDYEVAWKVLHRRSWVPVTSPGVVFTSTTGVTATTHHGALHAFGVAADGQVTHARTFSGAAWAVSDAGTHELAPDLPVTAVSFGGRLHLFGVHADGSAGLLAYTVDGASFTLQPRPLAGLQTALPLACACARDRLWVFARDRALNALLLSSSDDLVTWSAWSDVPLVGAAPDGPVVGVARSDALHLFGVRRTGKGRSAEIVHTASADIANWSPWTVVEYGARPEGESTFEPLDVAAVAHDDRIHLASRWISTTGEDTTLVAVNSSGDGENWVGWRVPPSDVVSPSHVPFAPSARAGVAVADDHVFVLAPRYQSAIADNTDVWAY